MPDKNVTDIVTLFTFLAALIFSNEVATVVGPYVVIIIAAAVGASFRLASRPTTGRADAFRFFLQQVGVAILFTAIAAAIVNEYRPDLSPRLTVAPIALLIGYLHWPTVLAKVSRFFIGSLDLLRGKGGTR